MFEGLEGVSAYGGTIVKGGVGALVIAVIARYAMQRLSRDWVDRHRDRAEVELVETLRTENKELRDRADKFAAERNDAVQKLGELTATANFLRQRVEELVNELAAVRAKYEAAS